GAVPTTMEGEGKVKTIPIGREVGVHDVELEGMYHAAEMALRYCRKNKRPFSHVHVFLDNQSAIQRVSDLGNGPAQTTAVVMNVLPEECDDLGTTLMVEWVPGHQGVDGNEISDRVAGDATLTESQNTTTSLSYIKR